MTTDTLLRRSQATGIKLWYADGQVRYRGPPDAVKLLLPEIKAYKQQLIAWFSRTAANDPDQPSAAPEPPTDRAQWLEIDREYQRHHWKCPTCQAAGRGPRYGLRCGAGAALWRAYSDLNR